jgi:hypothetical protein
MVMAVLLHQIQDNLLSPIIIAFVFGIAANLLRSDLKVPESIFTALSVYFLFGIGLKGGCELSDAPRGQILAAAAAAAAMGAVIPIICSMFVVKSGKFSIAYAALIASHCGFVSAVALFGAENWLDIEDVYYEPYMPAMVSAMEVTSLLVGVGAARVAMGKGRTWRGFAGEILFGKSILLILGGTLIGLASGRSGYEAVSPFFEEPFKGVACLLMMELGMSAARQFAAFRKFGAALVVGFGVLAPLVFGSLGVLVADLAGLSEGGRMCMGVLVASSAYLASAIAVRASMPELNPDYYFTASLAVNLPFNFTVGFPLFLAAAHRI